MRLLLPIIPIVLVLFCAPALTAGELGGVAMSDDAEAGGQTLTLNGLGLRKKFGFKVYVGGLYLGSKSSDAQGIVATDGPRHMVMHFLRKVSAKQLCGGWDEGLEGNSPNASAATKKDFETLCGHMEDVTKGDRLTFTYIPGTGTEITVKGTTKGTLKGKDFADALLACWLGAKPPSSDFKTGVLGQ